MRSIATTIRALWKAARGLLSSKSRPGVSWSDAAVTGDGAPRYRPQDFTRRINLSATWRDLVVPPDIQSQLKMICHRAIETQRMIEEWRLGNQQSPGDGLTILFAGPSGSGKTMAAEVVASELQMTLLEVDLSAIASKYIGETEKILGDLFDSADLDGVILLFDEADGLFGRRTEVTDAHDRYADLDLAYLLQRLETHAGIVILTTNRKENIEPAFTRRIRFVVDFPTPG